MCAINLEFVPGSDHIMTWFEPRMNGINARISLTTQLYVVVITLTKRKTGEQRCDIRQEAEHQERLKRQEQLLQAQDEFFTLICLNLHG